MEGGDAAGRPQDRRGPLDPRAAHPDVAALTAALRQRQTPIPPTDPEREWFDELQTELVRKGRPSALVGRPALAALRDQLNALRRGGTAAARVAAALLALPETAMPSEVVRFVEGRVTRGGRR